MRKIFGERDNKTVLKIIFAFILGLALLVMSNPCKKKTCDYKSKINSKQVNILETENNYEKNLETRLENLLSQVNGVGNVKVMITLAHGREVIIAHDINQSESISKTKDQDGSEKETQDKKQETKKIILDGKNPLVLKELEPKIEGVIIIAQGGENLKIKSDLIKSAQTVLNVQAHKIQVLKMK